MGNGIPSLSQALAVVRRRDQWKHSKRKVRKKQKEREAGSAAGAERSCSSSASACLEFKIPRREAGPPNHHDDQVASDQ